MKLILGTANLNNDYGKLNNFLNIENFKKSIKTLNSINSKFLETSFEYNNSIKALKKINLSKYQIILKINIKDELDFKKIDDFKRKIKIRSFYCIMLHDQDLLTDKNSNLINNLLKKLIINGTTKKIGISLYNFKNITSLFKRIKFNIVQLPFNIFDQRLQNKNFKVKKKFEKFITNQHYTKLFHCLNFIKQNEFIKKIVIGINNHNNLIEIIKNIKKKKIIIKFKKIKSSNIKIIDPNVW